ncbi:MAG TPA: RES family NAD+ phosphorylase [Puia sp.]|uniref:RES family NAD+ phosphorylase n=1 Tax=Puia sp. TaxID=2045100 RepID=UPI002B8A77E2|nr:RES family NAD+ phosphorylase [Puia sp.]HVU95271.1 RES family NAD+ phosphorylase [Puia sp.]
MIVYRIGRTRYANDLTGEGARLFGGRWNHKGVPCLYTSASRALALLEYTVNVNVDDIPRALSFTTLEIPDDSIHEVAVSHLPGDWRAVPSPVSTKAFGTAWLSSQAQGVWRVPSTVIPSEFNYLLNPLHPGISAAKILAVDDFVYDVRIKMV